LNYGPLFISSSLYELYVFYRIYRISSIL